MIFVVEVDGGEIKVLDKDGNPLETELDAGVRRLLVQARLAAGGAKQKVYLIDGVNEVELAVVGDATRPANTRGILAAGVDVQDVAHLLQTDGEGALKVANQPPQPPPGTTEFVLAVPEGSLEISSPPAYHETVSPVIGTGVELYLQLFTSGAAGDPSERGSRVDVLWQEGATPVYHVIERMYLSGQSVTVTLPDVHKARDGTGLTGNGSNTYLVIRRYRLSNATQEVDAVLRGYTE